MNRFFELNSDRKVVFFLCIAQKATQLINNDEQYRIVQAAIEDCWNQILVKQYDGETLYNYLDDEDNGITILLETCDDEKKSAAFNCIIDAIAYTSKYAYDMKLAKYYPEPISLVSDELVEHLIKCFLNCFSCNSYIEEVLSILSQNEIDKVKLKNKVYLQ